MTFWCTHRFHFLKNEGSLLRSRLSGRCQVSSSGPNPNQSVRIRFSFESYGTGRSITDSSPSESSSSASRAGALVAGTFWATALGRSSCCLSSRVRSR